MHIHNFVYIKTFKIAPTCFDPKIIFRELHCSLPKSHFLKHSLINFLILTRCCGSIAPECGCVSCVMLRETKNCYVCALVSVLMIWTVTRYLHGFTAAYGYAASQKLVWDHWKKFLVSTPFHPPSSCFASPSGALPHPPPPFDEPCYSHECWWR